MRFKAWRLSSRAEVVAASGLMEKALAWMMEIEKPTTTIESLAASGKKFLTLDTKLNSAVVKSCHGEVGRDLHANPRDWPKMANS